MNDYARKYNILKENDKNLSGEDVREGLTCIISVKLKEASSRARPRGAWAIRRSVPGQLSGVQEYDDLPGGEPATARHHF